MEKREDLLLLVRRTGLTQREIANKVGVLPVTLNSYLNGNNTIPGWVEKKIIKVCKKIIESYDRVK